MFVIISLFGVLSYCDMAMARRVIFPENIVHEHLERVAWGVYRREDRQAIIEQFLSLAADSREGEQARLSLTSELDAPYGFTNEISAYTQYANAIRLRAVVWLGELDCAEARPLLEAYAARSVPLGSSDKEKEAFYEFQHVVDFALWRIRVAGVADAKAQEELLMRIVDGSAEGGPSTRVRQWAMETLVDRIVPGTSECSANVAYDCWGKGLFLPREAECVERKICVMRDASNRVMAYSNALKEADSGPTYPIRRWAIAGLLKMNTHEALTVLMSCLRTWQAMCYADIYATGRIAEFKDGLSRENEYLCYDLGTLYRDAVRMLGLLDFDLEQLHGEGVFPDQYFFVLE